MVFLLYFYFSAELFCLIANSCIYPNVLMTVYIITHSTGEFAVFGSIFVLILSIADMSIAMMNAAIYLPIGMFILFLSIILLHWHHVFCWF